VIKEGCFRKPKLASGSGLKEVIFEREAAKKKQRRKRKKSRNEAGFDICSDLRLQN
jgi:hypothetical protein